MEEEIRRVSAARRKYSAEFKAQVLRECREPGASVAGTALSHGLNANLVHKWRRKADRAQAAGGSAAPGFIPLAMQRLPRMSADVGAGPGASDDPIQISVQRGAVRVSVRWPVQAAADCAAWLAEVIR